MRTLLIANRGEIAVRIIRAAQELGIETVQVYSDADKDMLAVQIADRAVNIGPPQAAKSYLNMDAVLAAAAEAGADAVHPGYGFFAENADFADAVTNAGMKFVGPAGDTIRRMGDKVAARQAAANAGVPTVPGSDGRLDCPDEARRIAEATGFPLLIKAAAGGGGRGIRLVNDLDEFDRLAPQARAEAEAAFGDGGLYIEKFVTHGRHVEVQILGDGTDAIHLHERECSLQRRRQKVWEEAPAPMLPDAVRAKLCDAAVNLAQAVSYSGAGTVEFMYDDDSGAFYFLEMNTRIQVEHPVSEMITGIDLIREMLLIADGRPMTLTQGDIRPHGHAIEVRINAENPAQDFLPFPGVVSDLSVPGGPGVRFDGMIYPGYAIPPFYDSLLGKLIVWAGDRDQAINRMHRALKELKIGGVQTTRPLHRELCNDPDVRAGNFHTRWLEDWLDKNATRLTD